MTIYYVDDGGDGTTESSWATADTSINDLDAEYAFVSGDIIYFGHDHVCQAVNAATLTITLPTSGLPTYFISATQGSSPATYQASTTPQIDTSEGVYGITFDGSFALYGMSLKSGSGITFALDGDEAASVYNTRFALGNAGTFNTSGDGITYAQNITIDLTADGTTQRTATVINLGGKTELADLTFVNAGYRTGVICTAAGRSVNISGGDFSGFTNATTCEIIGASGIIAPVSFNNCITVSNPTFFTTAYPSAGGEIIFTNCGPENSPTSLVYRNYFGDLVSTTAITRSGGGSVESAACSWLVTTRSVAGEATPFRTPWSYGKVSTTGSKTFDVYITNDTADYTDAEVWLEIESLNTTGEAIFARSSDTRAAITTTASAQTDDVTSTWNGTGPTYTYKQKLSVTATVNVAGIFRWRVCCGVASIASSRYFYVDPLCTVS